MKKLALTIMALLLTVAVTFMCAPAADAGRGGHHGGHGWHGGYHGWHGGHGWHRGGYYNGFWGYGPGVIWGGSPVVEIDECYTVKRCYINQFGERRCRLEQVCP